MVFVQSQHKYLFIFVYTSMQIYPRTHTGTSALPFPTNLQTEKLDRVCSLGVLFPTFFFWECVCFFFLRIISLGGNVQPLNWLMYILAVWFIIRNSLQSANNMYDRFNLPNHVPLPTIHYFSLPFPSLPSPLLSFYREK